MKGLEQEAFNTTCNCEDPTNCLCHMFVDMVQKKRVEVDGQCPVRRPVFLRRHGIIQGELKFCQTIPKHLQHGFIAEKATHPVYIRYSSDLADGKPDWMSTIGIGIKIFDVPGDKVVSDDGSHVADLLLQNVPYFFVDTAADMCAFTKASFEGWGDEWVDENSPVTNQLLDDMAKPIRSVFDTSLWSVVPFKLGEQGYCKYIVRPGRSTFAEEVDINDPNFLAKDLSGRMKKGEATLELFVQKRPDVSYKGQAYLDEHFPLDRATVTWSEIEAPPVKVAEICLPPQDIDKEEQQIYGDWLAFNVGRVPKENAPVGSIAETRMTVYSASANYRREKNAQPLKQPSTPGKPKIKNPSCPFPDHAPKIKPKELTKEQIKRISYLKIHPGIGVSRVGDSKIEYYIGPELTRPPLTAFGTTRDASGAIKRQAARFRIYAYDAQGNVVAEVQQSKSATIDWRVHIANKKAQWYEFNAAMDIPYTVDLSVPLRNPKVKQSERSALCIDPGETQISGIAMRDASFVMSGEFQGTPVTLGELRTDDVGRLLVLPGFGKSESPRQQPVYIPEEPNSFNNAAGWYDDIADGPVHAKVTIGDTVYNADSAWVISAPPNFAPDTIGWRSMDDLMHSVFIDAGMQPLPERVSFAKHIQPILERMSQLQWVNKGIASMFGADAPMNFQDPSLLEKLSKAPLSRLYPDPYGELRRTVYNSFRPSDTRTADRGAWPWQYGDAFGYTDPDPTLPPSPNTYLKLPPYYDYLMSAWVDGNFISDFNPTKSEQVDIEDVPLQEQPSTLDKAAMMFCLADAFHPGAELTWPMRHASMYRAPYRIRERELGLSEPYYGTSLNHKTVTAVGGPLYAQGPGDLTRWMAVPWQGDTAYCRSGYDMEYDPFIPTFWPARVPNQVLTEIDYETVMDKSQPMEIRIAAFNNRPSWLRQLPAEDPAPEQMHYMIKHFGDMGIIEARPKPDDIDWLPDNIYVENLSETKRLELDAAHKTFLSNYGKLGPEDRALQEAGWISEEQRNEFSIIKRRGN